MKLGRPVEEARKLFDEKGVSTAKEENRLNILVPLGGATVACCWLTLGPASQERAGKVNAREQGQSAVLGACKHRDMLADNDVARVVMAAVNAIQADADPTVSNNAEVHTWTERDQNSLTETLTIRMGQRTILLTRIVEPIPKNARFLPTLTECLGVP